MIEQAIENAGYSKAPYQNVDKNTKVTDGYIIKIANQSQIEGLLGYITTELEYEVTIFTNYTSSKFNDEDYQAKSTKLQEDINNIYGELLKIRTSEIKLVKDFNASEPENLEDQKIASQTFNFTIINQRII